jgi:hypothetical protein
MLSEMHRAPLLIQFSLNENMVCPRNGRRIAVSIGRYGSNKLSDRETNSRTSLQRIVERNRVVRVVGLSDQPSRARRSVSAYVQRVGYMIVPTRPRTAPDVQPPGVRP